MAIEGARGSTSAPSYRMLVFWLALLFGAFRLTAPPKSMVVTLIALGAPPVLLIVS
jgi:hypothetical protein